MRLLEPTLAQLDAFIDESLELARLKTKLEVLRAEWNVTLRRIAQIQGKAHGHA